MAAFFMFDVVLCLKLWLRPALCSHRVFGGSGAVEPYFPDTPDMVDQRNDCGYIATLGGAWVLGFRLDCTELETTAAMTPTVGMLWSTFALGSPRSAKRRR